MRTGLSPRLFTDDNQVAIKSGVWSFDLTNMLCTPVFIS